LVYFSINDSTEEVVQRMIEASQNMIKEQNNPIINEHFKLQIKSLQNAPRDLEKLEQLLKLKERQNDEARHIEQTQWLVTEIEMLKIILCLLNRNKNRVSGEQGARRRAAMCRNRIVIHSLTTPNFT
jgi:hypothetical protein